MLDFLFPAARRKKLREKAFPSELRPFIDRNVPYVKLLSDEERLALEGHMNVFLAEKSFEGCSGLEMTDEIRVTVAAQACLLLLHQTEPHYFPACDVILVYPSAYVAKGPRHDGLVVLDGGQARLGESSARGTVVLSWDDVKRGAYDTRDGHNVVLHEFAHQLDQEDGEADGAPPLSRRANYAPWAAALGAEFESLKSAVEHHRRADIDAYGATNPAEFFAVVTETFFEQPQKLQQRHPKLYEQFVAYYKQDPAARLAEYAKRKVK